MLMDDVTVGEVYEFFKNIIEEVPEAYDVKMSDFFEELSKMEEESEGAIAACNEIKSIMCNETVED